MPVEIRRTPTHTLWFGSQLREAVEAKFCLVLTDMRGVAGTSLLIPLGAVNGLHRTPRIGDRHEYLRELGRVINNPAGV